MKKNYTWLATSIFALTLSGCGGGEGGNINPEQPTGGGVTTSTACAATAEDCLEFILDYPVQGLNFECSSDNTNHFITDNRSNAVSGACRVADKVTFSIKGQNTDRQIRLGTVDLKQITSRKIANAPLSLVDIASAMAGRAPTELSPNDETIKIAMAMVKVFQAVSRDEFQNSITEIQPIELTESYKSELNRLSQSLNADNFKDGSYVALLRPWVDVSAIDDASAYAVVVKMINMQNAGVFQSDFLPWPMPTLPGNPQQYIQGFHGKSPLNNEIAANLYLLSDRGGYTYGYGLQWRGRPDERTSQGGVISDSLKRLTLITKYAPQKMNAEAQTTWINPLTKRIDALRPYLLSMANGNGGDLRITQGQLLNGYLVAGSEAVYKQTTGAEQGAPNRYGLWTQDANNERFDGSLDIAKSNLLTYLDKRVHTTANNVQMGGYYAFPLYATLIFRFNDRTVNDVRLGIVIDENGDIRSDIKPNATAYDMSGQCATITDNQSLTDSNGVRQFRLGTTGAANYSDLDKSLTIRMILANSRFGLLDGAMLGLNQDLGITAGINQSGGRLTSSGVKINLHNLLQDNNTNRGVTINNFAQPTPQNPNPDLTANWINIHAAYQLVYNNIENISPAPTDADRELAKRTFGTLGIELPNCYSIKQRN